MAEDDSTNDNDDISRAAATRIRRCLLLVEAALLFPGLEPHVEEALTTLSEEERVLLTARLGTRTYTV